jgi:hypothetical protein
MLAAALDVSVDDVPDYLVVRILATVLWLCLSG